MKRLLTIVIALAVAAFAATAGPAATALAHAEPVVTFPDNGAELDAPPAEVRITFSEPIVPASSRLIILDADGQPVPGAHQSAPDTVTLVLTLPPLERGVYTAAWEVLSTDTHTTSGQFTFSVAAGLSQTVPLQPGPSGPPPAGGSADPGEAAAEGGRDFPWLWVVLGTGLLVLFSVAMRRR